MGFSIAISEVTPNEFPLMQVLRDTVFDEFGHRSLTPIATGLADRKDLFLLMAHLEGNPVGFSAGYQRTGKSYYLNYIAILRDYRRQGLGRRMIHQQESFAAARGYKQIEFNTFNRFAGILRLGVQLGYRPIGLELHVGTENDLALRFGKLLNSASQPDAELLGALSNGKIITGLQQTPEGQLCVLVS